MPYLTYLFCEKCGVGHNLDIDSISTLEAYQKEGRKSAFINQATVIWDYMIYSCYSCGAKYKYTYQDVERRVREHFRSLSEKYEKHIEELIEQRKLEERELEKIKQQSSKRVKTKYSYKGK
jgi:hypothetical protein